MILIFYMKIWALSEIHNGFNIISILSLVWNFTVVILGVQVRVGQLTQVLCFALLFLLYIRLYLLCEIMLMKHVYNMVYIYLMIILINIVINILILLSRDGYFY